MKVRIIYIVISLIFKKLDGLLAKCYQHKNGGGKIQRIFAFLCMKLIEIHRINTIRVYTVRYFN